MYGKLVGGELVKAPAYVKSGGAWVLNPSVEQYLDAGYYPVDPTVPTPPAGKVVATLGWCFDGAGITRVATFADAPAQETVNLSTLTGLKNAAAKFAAALGYAVSCLAMTCAADVVSPVHVANLGDLDIDTAKVVTNVDVSAFAPSSITSDVYDVQSALGGKANTAALGNYATTQRVAQAEANVASMWYTLYGESCWIAVTNYMRTIPGVMPSFSLWEVRDGATNEVYSSRDEITNRVEAAVGPLRESVADALEKAELAKAWGRHQSADGSAAPVGYTIVSSTNLVLTGGGKWEGIVLETLGRTFWVFSGAGGLTSTSEGKLRCIDANGDTAFEVTTGTMQTLPAIPASFQVESTADGKDVTFSVYATNAPTLWSSTDLLGPWFAHSNATWTAGLSNTYTVAMTVDSTSPAMFFRATYELGQQPCVKFAKPLELTQVKLGDTIYNVSVSDGKLALTEAN